MNLRKWVVRFIAVVAIVCCVSLGNPSSTSANTGSFTFQLTCSEAQQLVTFIDSISAELQEWINSGAEPGLAAELSEWISFLDTLTDNIQAKYGSATCVIPD